MHFPLDFLSFHFQQRTQEQISRAADIYSVSIIYALQSSWEEERERRRRGVVGR